MERLLLGRRPRPMLRPDQLSVMMNVPQIAGSARDKISQFQQPWLEADVVVGSFFAPDGSSAIGGPSSLTSHLPQNLRPIRRQTQPTRETINRPAGTIAIVKKTMMGMVQSGRPWGADGQVGFFRCPKYK
jgi:hypothetical protein